MNQQKNNNDRQLRRLFQKVKRQDQETARPFDEFIQHPAPPHQEKFPGWAIAAVVALLIAGCVFLVRSNQFTPPNSVAIDFDELFKIVDQEFESEWVAPEIKAFDQHSWMSSTDSLLAINFAAHDNHNPKSP